MSLIRSIALFVSAILTILSAYAFGHGLSEGHAGPYVMSAVALGLAGVLVFLQVRMGRDSGASH